MRRIDEKNMVEEMKVDCLLIRITKNFDSPKDIGLPGSSQQEAVNKTLTWLGNHVLGQQFHPDSIYVLLLQACDSDAKLEEWSDMPLYRRVGMGELMDGPWSLKQVFMSPPCMLRIV
jgi:hypothetical protein